MFHAPVTTYIITKIYGVSKIILLNRLSSLGIEEDMVLIKPGSYDLFYRIIQIEGRLTIISD